MQPLIPLLTTVLPVLYALSVAAYGRAYADEASSGGRWGPVILRTAVVLHLVYLLTRGLMEGHLPLASAYDFLSATGFSAAAQVELPPEAS